MCMPALPGRDGVPAWQERFMCVRVCARVRAFLLRAALPVPACTADFRANACIAGKG